MDYEKKYKEAIERAKTIDKREYRDIISTIFPELKESKESEDEKIRKAIRYAIGQSTHSDGTLIDRVSSEEALAWLEEQGEQKPTESQKDYYNIDPHFGKPIDFKAKNFYVSKVDGKIHDMTYNTADKVESKFKVGDWITNGRYAKLIVGINSDWSLYMFKDGTSECIKDIDKKYHLWTIADAKNGDILTGEINGDTYILIYKQTTDRWIETYGHYYNAVNRFCAPSQLFCRDYQGTFTPASKEQRNLLFSIMKEAGYEWDAEKKELKKIEQKPAWSEEDETRLTNIIIMLKEGASHHFIKDDITKAVDWLKSIKQRMGG